jgi:hypothetical protein
LIKAKINGVSGNFIRYGINSCVGFESIELFLLTAEASKTKASGAGATGMFTQTASNNKLLILKDSCIRFSDFDLSHVNEALIQHKSKPVHGIIERTYY